MRLLYNHDVIIKAAPLMKPVKPQQMTLSKSKWHEVLCALPCTLVILSNRCYEN